MFKVSYIFDLVDKVSPQLNKIQSNLQSTANQISVISRKIGDSFDHIQNKIGSANKRARRMGRDLFLKTTLPIAIMGGAFVKAASDYAESINKVDVAFGDSSKSVKDFANSAGKNFGIDRGSALDMAAMFGDMATGMGLTQTKAAGLATSLVGLAGDLASFKNIGVDQAQTALAGIFTGETESLKRLGIVMTQANLQQFALTKGVTKKIEKMKQAEVVMLRYNYIMAMSKNSLGDFVRTQAGFANQFRILKSRFKDLSITLGTFLLPYAIKLVNVAITLIEKFQALSPATQKIILVIAGLVAVLAPLLIAIGFVGVGLAALTAGFMFLTTPIGMITIAIIAFSSAMVYLYDDMLIIYNFVKDNLVSVFDYLADKINSVMDIFKQFKNDFMSIKEFLGFGGADNTLNQNIISNQTPINQNQSLTAGGQLDINFRGMPQGASAKFTPAPKNFMNTGLNTIFGGM